MLAPLAILTLLKVLTELTVLNNAKGVLWLIIKLLTHQGNLEGDRRVSTMLSHKLHPATMVWRHKLAPSHQTRVVVHSGVN